MTASVTLLMAVHCHQPVGNFGFVFEEAYAKAYEPFLGVLERHPTVRLALHYSGCLLDWMTRHRPEFLARVRALAAKGQVELLASGYYEPILPLIPEADRQGQIAMMRQAIQTHFGTDSEGVWLTERVWEPELPQTLARAGMRYTMVDTNQFVPSKPWLPQALQVQDDTFWDLLGCCTTEYAGSSIVLFPASKRLRYWMPFQPVDQTIEFLKRLRRPVPVAITFADDGEKFGLWPKTYRWVYEEGWLDQFFGALEREREWLTTTTFRDYLTHAEPVGPVSLACGSYEEMLEWSGGNFRNFFTKYPEANAMYQKMLQVSRALDGLRTQDSGLEETAEVLRKATEELYAAQCNCAYWHGVFGGLYLRHPRRAVYEHLLRAEQLLNGLARTPRGATAQASGGVETIASDVDGDGREEVALVTDTMRVVIEPDEGGTITEWSLYGSRINLLDTLTRRPEPYHDKLRAKTAAQPAAAQGVASIHDVLGVKEEHLESHLVYDDHRRSAFLDYALQGMPTLQDVVRSTWGERRLWSTGPYQWEASAAAPSSGLARVTLLRDVPHGRIRKVVSVSPHAQTLECACAWEVRQVPVVGLEFNVCLRDERYLSHPAEEHDTRQFRIAEPALGVSLRMECEPKATLYHFPIETVSESEGGLERTYQGLCVVCLWAVEGTGLAAARVTFVVEAA